MRLRQGGDFLADTILKRCSMKKIRWAHFVMTDEVLIYICHYPVLIAQKKTFIVFISFTFYDALMLQRNFEEMLNRCSIALNIE